MSRSSDGPHETGLAGRRAILRERLDGLPDGHPSSPRDENGRPRPVSPAPAELHAADPAEDSWREAVPRLADAWQRHQQRWPDQPGAAAANGRDRLASAVGEQLTRGCEKIRHAERSITPRMRDVEAGDQGRALIGLGHRLKGPERLTEKVAQDLARKPGRIPADSLALIPDAIRYTFRYRADGYAAGVRDDIGRLRSAGFEFVKLKNYWDDPEYKGINSQWRDVPTGQRFEVQFHTAVSFEAKQLSHGAYEQLRTGLIGDQEEQELETYQRKVAALVPVPPGARDIPDYP